MGCTAHLPLFNVAVRCIKLRRYFYSKQDMHIDQFSISDSLGQLTLWRNGSASDSRSEGCVFKSRQGQHFILSFETIRRCRQKKFRNRQDSNLRSQREFDFESNALTTRPRLPIYRWNGTIQVYQHIRGYLALVGELLEHGLQQACVA